MFLAVNNTVSSYTGSNLSSYFPDCLYIVNQFDFCCRVYSIQTNLSSNNFSNKSAVISKLHIDYQMEMKALAL